jgi:hypothetical protein
MATDHGLRITDMDKQTELMIDALKQCLADPAEQRLFKSGKTDGLFATRTGVNGEAAARALNDGLLEVARTETKGKSTTEWVRVTPRAMEFLHAQESPVQALKDLQIVLQANRERIPLWLIEMQRELLALSGKLADAAQRWTHRLETLANQVDEALRRAETSGPQLSNGATTDAPWALAALTYLDQRQAAGANGACPLPELFKAVRDKHADLSMTDFHERLRRLRDRRALNLLPFSGAANDIPEPEHALLDGPDLLYYVTR